MFTYFSANPPIQYRNVQSPAVLSDQHQILFPSVAPIPIPPRNPYAVYPPIFFHPQPQPIQLGDWNQVQPVAQQPPKKDFFDSANPILIFANGGIQIGVISTGAIAGLGSGTTAALVTGAVLAVLAGGRISLYLVEICEKGIKHFHKVSSSDRSEKAKEILHIEDSLDVVNRLLKGVIQSGQFITASVAGYLNTTNWVARNVTAPILTSMAVAELLVLSEEVVLNSFEVIFDKFKTPVCIERINSLVRGVIQIIAISSLAAAGWAASTQIVLIIGYIRTALLTGRILTFVAEISLLLLNEYKKMHQPTELAAPGELPFGFV